MTKKSVNKIVSAILVMAICLTTVFSCLITVSAADATGNYTITSDDVPSGARIATTYVTLKSDTGFSSGSFDLMFDDSVLDTNYGVNESLEDFYKRDTNGDSMIAVQDKNGNFVFDDGTDVKENANNKGTRLPNVYDEYYVDTNNDGVNDSLKSNLYDTKIEIVDGVKTEGEFSLGDFYSYYADTESALALDSAATNDETNKVRYKYNATAEYIESQKAAQETDSDEIKKLRQLGKYYRSYSTVDVETESLSYAISTVSEDSEGLVARYTQYAQGFENVTFDAGSNTYTSITFKVTFDFSGRTDRMSANSVAKDTTVVDGAREDGRYCGDNQVQLGLTYKLKLTPDSESAIAEFTNTQKNTNYDNFHIHRYYTTKDASNLISDKTANGGYAIYQGYCSECQSTNPEYKAPMIATSAVAETLAEGNNYYFHNYKNVYGFNVVYEEDGTLSVNIHFDEYNTGDTFIIGLSDGTKTKYSEFTIANPDASFFATVEYWDADKTYVVERDVRALRNSAKMVTINGLSAKDIDTQLYIARMGKDGNGDAVIGRTHVFSLADYCMKVINEQDVYYFKDETVTNTNNQYGESDEAEKQNDKNVAAALINYGRAAKAALNQSYDGIFAPTDKTIYWDGKTYTNPTAKDSDGNILINTAAELAYIALKATAAETKGNSYKVADNIANIILQPEDVVDGNTLMNLTDNAEVKSYLTSLSGAVEWIPSNSACFNGNFNGNGATVYGIYQNEEYYCGLFPFVDGGTAGKTATNTAGVGFDYDGNTIKNLAVRNSYMNTKWRVGIIVGYCYSNTTGAAVSGTINLNGCTVANCYIEVTESDNNNKAVLINAGSSEKYHINNCIVYGNYAVVNDTDICLVAGTPNTYVDFESDTNGRVYSTVENSIILDTPLHSGKKAYAANTVNNFEKVYTNVDDYQLTTDTTDTTFYYQATDIDSVTTAGVQGNVAVTNMPNLDWSKWSYGAVGSYPTPAYPNEQTNKTIYWDNTTDQTLADNGETGNSWDNAIIIDSAEELAYLAQGADGNTQGVYYKINDNIKSIVLQNNNIDTIKSFANADKVKQYFENSDNDKLIWTSSQNKPFRGYFDGNGATIYGMYAKNALFGHVNIDTIIKNVSVKNSYITGTGALGAIVGQNVAEAATKYDITITGCEVANNCIISTRTSSGSMYSTAGVLAGNIGNAYTDADSVEYPTTAQVSNCLIYGNIAKHQDGTVLGMIGGLGANYSSVTKTWSSLSNSIVLGTTPYRAVANNFAYSLCDKNIFTNIYTDAEIENVNWANSSTNTSYANITFTNMHKIDAADLLGINAQSIVDAINLANGDSRDMHVGAIDGYPSFSEVPALTTELLADYTAMTFDYDEYRDSTTEFGLYATSLNLKVNPYMSFTFAFHGNHKTDRQNISVTFTTDGGEVYTAGKIPAYTGEDLPNTNGWTNKYPAGRYHLYRLTDIDVIDLCKGITINATHGSDSFETKVSIGGFVLDLQNAYKADPCEYYSTRIEAARALLFYAQMVNARYA